MMLQTLQSVLTLPVNKPAPSQKHETSGYFHESSFNSDEFAALVKDYESGKDTAHDSDDGEVLSLNSKSNVNSGSSSQNNLLEYNNLSRSSNKTKRRFATVLAAASVAALCTCASSFSGLQMAGNASKKNGQVDGDLSASATYNVENARLESRASNLQSGLQSLANEDDALAGPETEVPDTDTAVEQATGVEILNLELYFIHDLHLRTRGDIFNLQRMHPAKLTGFLEQPELENENQEDYFINANHMDQFMKQAQDFFDKFHEADHNADGSTGRIAKLFARRADLRDLRLKALDVIQMWRSFNEEYMKFKTAELNSQNRKTAELPKEVGLQLEAAKKQSDRIKTFCTTAMQSLEQSGSGLRSGMQMDNSDLSASATQSSATAMQSIEHAASGHWIERRWKTVNYLGSESDLSFIEDFQHEFVEYVYASPFPDNKTKAAFETQERADVACRFIENFMRVDLSYASRHQDFYAAFYIWYKQVTEANFHGGKLTSLQHGLLGVDTNKSLLETMKENLTTLETFLKRYEEFIRTGLNPENVPTEEIQTIDGKIRVHFRSEEQIAANKRGVAMFKRDADAKFKVIKDFVLLTRGKFGA